MRTVSLATLLSLSFFSCSASDADEKLRVVAVEKTPGPDRVDISIDYPEKNSVQTTMPVRLQIHLQGFPLGTNTDNPREREIRNEGQGQTVRVIIDDRPMIELNETHAPNDAFDDHEQYYDQTLDYDIRSLSSGMHVIRAFTAFSYGESVKEDEGFTSSVFYYKNKSDDSSMNIKQPFITYNEPTGKFSASQPVLLDFYLCNCELSSDGYKVKLSVDGEAHRLLTQWTPYYIYGLSRGTHNIRLQLLDASHRTVSGDFNDVSHTIVVY